MLHDGRMMRRVGERDAEDRGVVRDEVGVGGGENGGDERVREGEVEQEVGVCSEGDVECGWTGSMR